MNAVVPVAIARYEAEVTSHSSMKTDVCTLSHTNNRPVGLVNISTGGHYGQMAWGQYKYPTCSVSATINIQYTPDIRDFHLLGTIFPVRLSKMYVISVSYKGHSDIRDFHL